MDNNRNITSERLLSGCVYSGEVDPLIPGQVDPLYQWPVSSSVKELE